MSFSNDNSCRQGYTLLEIMIGLAILGVLVALAVSSFEGINEKYKVEGEVKQLYADLMDARGRAMQRNRYHFVQIGTTSYSTYEDTNPPPDGNRSYDSGLDTRVTGVSVRHTMVSGVTDFVFDRNGIAADNNGIAFSSASTIRFDSTAKPDYDCITIQATRIKMGQMNGTSCDEK